MAHIAVHGSASRSVPPEQGTAHLSVTSSGDDRAAVLAAAQQAHAGVVALAQEYVELGAATGWTSPTVHAWAYQDWVPVPVERGGTPGQTEPVTRYRAGADVQVTFTQIDALGEFVAALGDLADVNTQHLAWDLTKATRGTLLREVRAEASRDALARAADYCAALGLGAPTLVGLYEDGLHPGTAPGADGGGPAFRTLKAQTAFADAGGGGGFDLRPRDIEVTAEVTATLEAG